MSFKESRRSIRRGCFSRFAFSDYPKFRSVQVRWASTPVLAGELVPHWKEGIGKERHDAAGFDVLGGDVADEPIGGRSGIKRHRLSDDSVTSNKRPVGRDKVKKMAKGASSGSGMDAIREAWFEFKKIHRQHLDLEKLKLEYQREEQEMKEKMRKEKIQMQKMKQEEENRVLEMRCLMGLLSNYDNLTPQQRGVADFLQKQLFPSE